MGIKIKRWLIILISGFSILSTSAQEMPGLDLLQGTKKIEIPFRYSAGYILLEVEIHGVLKMNLIYDTGAEHTILFEKQITDILGIKYQKEVKLRGSDLSSGINSYIARAVDLQIKGTPKVKRDIVVLEENFLNLKELTGINIDGIVGSRYFKNMIVEIDYKKKKLIIWNPNLFDKRMSNYQKLPITIDSNKPYLNCTTVNQSGESFDIKVLIDTGAALTFLLNANDNLNIKVPEMAIPGSLGIGISGIIQGYKGRMSALSFGGFEFQNLLTSFQEINLEIDPEEYNSRNGIIGNHILERFNFIIDYLHQEIYFKPIKKLNKPFKYNLSGMSLLAFGIDLENYIVFEVIVNSPAEVAGIQAGDVIKKIGRLSASRYTLDDIERLLSRRAGKRIKVEILRGEETMEKLVILKDYIPTK